MSNRANKILALALKTRNNCPRPTFGEICIQDANALENNSTQDATIRHEETNVGISFEDEQIQQEPVFNETIHSEKIFLTTEDMEIVHEDNSENTEIFHEPAAVAVFHPLPGLEPFFTESGENIFQDVDMSPSQTAMNIVMHDVQIHQGAVSGDTYLHSEEVYNTPEESTSQFTTVNHTETDMDAIIGDSNYQATHKENSVEVLRTIDLNLNGDLLATGVYTIEIGSTGLENIEPHTTSTLDSDIVSPVRNLNENVLCSENDNGIHPPEVLPKKKVKRNKPPNKQAWEKIKSSNSRMIGEEYVGRSKDPNDGKIKYNKQRKSRKLGPPCNSKACEKSGKRFCNEISDDMRKKIFDYFWSDMTWPQRKTYVSSLVDCRKPKQKRRKDSGDRRGNTYHFHLKVNDERKEVCRSLFCNTLSLGVWSVQNWAKNVNHGIPQINRKRNIRKQSPEETNNSSRTIEADIASVAEAVLNRNKNMQYVEEFFDALPKMESHYCRKDTTKLYLEPVFTYKSDLYRLYKNNCQEIQRKAISIHTFMKVFNAKKISLFRPKKDQCDTCIGYKVGSISAEEYKIHQEAKETARKEKERDKLEMEQNKQKGVLLCVDVQAVKCAPFITASAVYFKTKLCCHNYTVYNIITHETDCFWWDETEGALDSTTFTSLLIKHLMQLISSWDPKVDKHIIIWSDGCVYQNKNNVLANALLEISVKHQFIIEQKYLEVGHTQMEGDSVHATIERKLKNREIHLPSDYVSVTREARIEPFAYKAHYITHEMFLDYSMPTGLRYSSIRPGNKKGDLTVNDLCHLKYLPTGKIIYKTKFQDEGHELPRRPKNITRPIEYPRLYKSRIKIKATKFNHLQELKSVLPKDTHHFYNSLPHL